MAEHRLFQGSVPYVSTAGFHEYRERAAHLEQDVHRPRLLKAAEFVHAAVDELHEAGHDMVTVSDLGCGDGGFLSLLRFKGVEAWGYDFQPSNQAGWGERDVKAMKADVFGRDRDTVLYGDIVVMTEVLEHLADPHGVVQRLAAHPVVRHLVCSSPWTETPESHDECHAWCWDQDGYRALIEQAGFKVQRHSEVGMFQVILAVKP